MDMDVDMDIIYPVNMGKCVSQGGSTNGLRRVLNAYFSFASKTRVAQFSYLWKRREAPRIT
jgi:hypothetical protein